MSRHALTDLLALACLTAVLVLLFARGRTPSWLHAWLVRQGWDRAEAMSLESLEGVRIELSVLGGRRLRVEGRSARLVHPGPVSIGGVWNGIELRGFRGTLGESGVEVRARHARIGDQEIELVGAVRMNDQRGDGVLFAPRLHMAVPVDRVTAEDISVLVPEGTEGGAGGVARLNLSARLGELLKEAERLRR